MTLQQALQYLMTGGAVMLGAAFVSWLAENAPPFQALSAGLKQAAIVAVSLVLALGAWAILKYVPPATLEDLSAPFGIAATTIGALLASQWWHANVNKKLDAPDPAPKP